MMVVSRGTVVVIRVIVTAVRMHVDRGGPQEGPHYGGHEARGDQATHAKSLSQHLAILDIRADATAILKVLAEDPLLQNRRHGVCNGRTARGLDATG